MARKIIQLIPVNDVSAFYKKADRAEHYINRVICMALTEEDGLQYVRGIDVIGIRSDQVSVCEDNENFLGYEPPDTTEKRKKFLV